MLNLNLFLLEMSLFSYPLGRNKNLFQSLLHSFNFIFYIVSINCINFYTYASVLNLILEKYLVE